MSSKRTFYIILLILVVVIGGAYALYTGLSSSVSAQQLALADQGAAGDVEEDKAADEAGKDGEADEVAQKSKEEDDRIEAPDFTVYDAEGNEVRLSEHIGKPIVLNFWASWCGPCQMEMPDFHEKYLELSEDINFMMINMTDGSRETVESASGFIEEQGYTFPVFYDSDTEAAMNYGAYSLPTTFFIDAEGYVVARATGAIDADTLQKGIDMIK